MFVPEMVYIDDPMFRNNDEWSVKNKAQSRHESCNLSEKPLKDKKNVTKIYFVRLTSEETFAP